ncbi:MAG: sialate O-acetylesterase [Psychroflexus sp.]
MKFFKCAILLLALTVISCEKNADLIKKDTYFLVAGQSNAMGVGHKEKSIHQDNINVLEYNSKYDDFTILNDPVGESHMGFQKAQTGSFIPALGYTYNKLTNRQVIIIQAAKGGSALTKKAETNNWGNWSPTGTLFQQSISKIEMMKSCIINENNSFKLNAIFWSQGENDGQAIARNKITKKEYKKSFINLINRYKEEYGNQVPFIIIETGRHGESFSNDEGFTIIREAQREVADMMQNVYIGYNETEYFIERNWLKDAVHYNQEALNHIGTSLAYFYESIRDKN